MKKYLMFINFLIFTNLYINGQSNVKQFIHSDFEYELINKKNWTKDWSLLIEDDGVEIGYFVANYCYTPHIDHLYGSSDYLVLNLKEPLKPGNIYQFIVDYEVDENSILDNYFPDHIGVAITYRDPMMGHYRIKNVCSKFFKPNKQLKEQTFNLVFRPLNEINYIAIGTFRDDDEDKYEEDLRCEYHKFKVKNVQLLGFKGSDSTVFIEEHTPKQYVIPPKKNISIDFESKAFTLTENEKWSVVKYVDSIKQLEEFKGVFEIRGYTDTVGTYEDNYQLAFDRINSIYKLLDKDSLNTIKVPFIEDTSGLRQVVLQPSWYTMGNYFYTLSIKAFNSGNIQACYSYLKKAVYTLNDKDKIFLITDPRIAGFRTSKYWKVIELLIKKSYDQYSNPELGFKLDSLYTQDQYYRSLEYDLNQLTVKNYLDEIQLDTIPYILDGPYPYDDHDKENLKALEQLIVEFGWPKISDVGLLANYAAFLIIQHSDLNTMLDYVDVLYKSALTGESKLKHWATMIDRIKIQKGEKQKYGTQYKVSTEGKLILEELENESKIDEYRKEVGLKPLDRRDIYIKGFLKK